MSNRLSKTFAVGPLKDSPKRPSEEISDSSGRAYVWIPHGTRGFIQGFIVKNIDDDPNKILVRCEDDTDCVVSPNVIEKVNPPQFDKVSDMAELTYLNEASVVYNLSRRYADDLIYTYSGLFLVAVNPYRQLPIYNDKTISKYHKAHRDELPPHIYALTDLALRSLMEVSENQSILVTGESGAGKTETTKRVIQYLAGISSSSTISSSSKSHLSPSSSISLERQILQANPILEAFGNAQTVRNNNSSRFGKFVRIEFERSGTIIGASIDYYLLEKSRVISQGDQERNYHIFYQLLCGEDGKDFLLSGNPQDYTYLRNTYKTIQGVNDAEEYRHLIESFSVIGLEKEMKPLLSLVAAVLHLGNVQVQVESADQARLSVGEVEKACHLLGVRSDEFVTNVAKPRVKAGREWVQQTRSQAQVRFALDALAKSIYEKVFATIVSLINKTLGSTASKNDTRYIGVLDIAGFEIFETNSFEQLCINYTNERLQQFFNHHMFVLEQDEYLRENIEWNFVDFGHDLQPTIDLIEKASPMGIFSCLDEECVMPRATDRSFTDKLDRLWDKTSQYKASRLTQGFVLTHYAAQVEYTTDQWLEKNRDPLSENVVDILSKSSVPLVRQMFGEDQPSKLSGVKRGIFRTVAQKHKEQLTHLMAQLEATKPHFVRCIIPNHEKTPKLIDNLLVLDQLRCNGVLEGIRIARSGFPNRLFFSEFRQRYGFLGNLPSGYLEGQKASSMILHRLKLDSSLYRIGLTKVFFKAGVLAELEERREAAVRDSLVKLQSICRGRMKRKSIQRELHQVTGAEIVKANFVAYIRLRNQPWWSLYVKLRPLLLASRESGNNQLVKTLRKTLKNKEESQKKLAEQQVLTEQKLQQVMRDLEAERSLAFDKEEILKRTQARELELEQQLTTALDDLDQLESRCGEVLSSNGKLETQIEIWRKEVTNGAQLLQQLQQEKKGLENDMNNKALLLSDLQQKMHVMESQLQNYKEKIQSSETTMQEKLEEQYRQCTECEALLQSKTKELEAAKTRMSKMEDKHTEHSHQLNSYEIQVKELEAERTDLQEALNERAVNDQILQLQVKVAQQFEAHTSEREKLQGEIAAKQQTVDRLHNELADLEKKVEQYEVASRKLAEKEKEIAEAQNYRAQIKELKAQLEQNSVKQGIVENDLKNSRKQHSDLKLNISRLQDLNTKLDAKIKDNELTIEALKLDKTDCLKSVELVRTELEHSKLAKDKLEKDLSHKIKRISILEEQEKEARVSLQQLKQTLQVMEQKEIKASRDQEDLHHDFERQQKEVLTLERKVSSLRKQADDERQKRSESEVSRRKVETSVESLRRALQEKTSQFETLKTVLKGMDLNDAVDLAERLKDEMKARKQIQESNLLLQAQLRDAQKRISETWQDQDAQMIAKRRSLLFDELANVGNTMQPNRPKSVPNFDKLERNIARKGQADVSSKKAARIFETDLETDDKENLQGKSKEELEDLLMNIRKSKNELLGVYHETAKNLVQTKDQLAESSLVNKQLERENHLLGQGSGHQATELKLLLEAETAKSNDLLSSVHLYRNRAEEYYNKLESAESVVIKAQRAEQSAKAQAKDAEEALARAQKERAAAESLCSDLQSKVAVLEENLENTKIDLAHAHNIQQTQAKDLEIFNERWQTEMGNSKLTLDAMRARYSEEIRTLSSELETHRQRISEMENGEIGGSNSLKQQVQELRQANEDAQLAHQDSQKRIGSLLSQVRTLRSTMEGVTKERDQLMKDKRVLESRLNEVSKEFEAFTAASERLERKFSVRTTAPAPRADVASAQLLQQAKQSLEAEKKRCEVLQKEHKQLELRILELETRSNTEDSQFLRSRIQDLEGQIVENSKKFADELRQARSDDRSYRDLESRLTRSQNLNQRFQEESEKSASKMKHLQQLLEQAQAEETAHRISARRAEREARDLKERSLRLEKELESWKERLDRKSFI